MKKFISIALAVLLLLGSSFGSFAENGVVQEDTRKCDHGTIIVYTSVSRFEMLNSITHAVYEWCEPKCVHCGKEFPAYERFADQELHYMVFTGSHYHSGKSHYYDLECYSCEYDETDEVYCDGPPCEMAYSINPDDGIVDIHNYCDK